VAPYTHNKLARLCSEAYDRCNVDVEGTQALVINDVDKSTVIYRGTEKNHEDILTDLRGYPWYDRELGFCHRGFLEAHRTSFLDVLKLIKNRDNCTFTGHSLGGALATLAAAELTMTKHTPAALVTFGEPRTGFRKLGHVLRSAKGCRYVYGKDVVPTVPWPIGFHHWRNEFRIPKWTKGSRFEDHKIINYINSV